MSAIKASLKSKENFYGEERVVQGQKKIFSSRNPYLIIRKSFQALEYNGDVFRTHNRIRHFLLPREVWKRHH